MSAYKTELNSTVVGGRARPNRREFKAAVEIAQCFTGFQGLGFGLKETAGHVTRDSAWRVYVCNKLPPAHMTRAGRVPAQLLGRPTDVLLAGHTAVASAAAGSGSTGVGVMIANNKGVPGTIGCCAWLSATRESVLLSSYHVLFGKRGKPGDAIWRILPDAEPNDYQRVGRNLMGKADQHLFGGRPYFIDAAIGEIEPRFREEWERPEAHMRCDGSAEAAIGDVVSKTGAVTGQTLGQVVDVAYPANWYADYRSVAAPNQILIKPTAEEDEHGASATFCATGDSGAVVRDRSNRALGLLWGNNGDGGGVACHMRPVLHALGLQLMPTGAPRSPS